MKNYSVYMVLCADGSYYTGITNSVERRVSEHNLGFDRKSYTFSRRPVKLVYAEVFFDVNAAIAAEKRIKGWCRAKKAALVKSDWRRIVELSNGHPSTSSDTVLEVKPRALD